METHESNDLRMVWEAGSNWRSPAALTSTLLSLFQTIPNLEMVMTSSLTEKSNGIRSQDAMLLNEEVILPCGAVSPNRLFKAPMEEMLATLGGGNPNGLHLNLYRKWAKGGWGIIITGNVAIDPSHLGLPFDVILPPSPHLSKDPSLLSSFKAYAKACKGLDSSDSDPSHRPPLAIVQLNHPGRQSMRGLGRYPWEPSKAPSSIGMKSTGLSPLDWLLFGTPKEMDQEDIKDLVKRFEDAAYFCEMSGFDGVEIHASHGYLLSAFLSPRTNKRSDSYGGSSKARCKLLLEIVEAISKRCSPTFAVGVKLNSSDFMKGGLSEGDALLNVKWLAESGQCDFVEISGGNYENPSFISKGFSADEADLQNEQFFGKKPISNDVPKASTEKREAFFISFASQCRSVLPESSKMKFLLVGGLRSRSGMASAIKEGRVDMVGMGRPSALFPELANNLTDEAIPDQDQRTRTPDYEVPDNRFFKLLGAVKLVGAGWNSAWHDGQMAYLSRNQEVQPKASILTILSNILFPYLVDNPRWNQGMLLASVVVFCAALFQLYSMV